MLDAIAASGFQAPGTDNILVSIRKAMTTIYAAGYNPDTLILTPANAEAIDMMVTGVTGGTADFVFGAGRFAPGTLFGLNVRVSKTIPAAGRRRRRARSGSCTPRPVWLATFEENAGKTNTSLVRMERPRGLRHRAPGGGDQDRGELMAGTRRSRSRRSRREAAARRSGPPPAATRSRRKTTSGTRRSAAPATGR